jgi:hypothetical protein
MTILKWSRHKVFEEQTTFAIQACCFEEVLHYNAKTLDVRTENVLKPKFLGYRIKKTFHCFNRLRRPCNRMAVPTCLFSRVSRISVILFFVPKIISTKLWTRYNYVLWCRAMGYRRPLALRKNLLPPIFVAGRSDQDEFTSLIHQNAQRSSLNIYVITLNIPTRFSPHGLIIIGDDIRCIKRKHMNWIYSSLFNN